MEEATSGALIEETVLLQISKELVDEEESNNNPEEDDSNEFLFPMDSASANPLNASDNEDDSANTNDEIDANIRDMNTPADHLMQMLIELLLMKLY